MLNLDAHGLGMACDASFESSQKVGKMRVAVDIERFGIQKFDVFHVPLLEIDSVGLT